MNNQFFRILWDAITVTLHQRRGIWNHKNQAVCSTVLFQRKHQRFVQLSLYEGIHRWPVDFPHKAPVIRKTFQCHEVTLDHTLDTGIKHTCFIYTISHKIYSWFCCALFPIGCIISSSYSHLLYSPISCRVASSPLGPQFNCRSANEITLIIMGTIDMFTYI